ncbi:MAG TPA: SWIM zinc finger family protein [Bacillota bacterium]|jgi:hypothetical protein|nr:SWIM zinc finger family protein [Bacillota bacterium]HOL08904.1 SWIM zinc finger family protein [Bacillota bacterium]HPO96597.1 SWIM zinc finger family protein [Bacillota bacterium]
MKLKDFSLAELQLLAASEIFERGVALYEEGFLVTACVLEELIAGKVLGSGGFYHASLQFKEERLHWNCSCPYPDFCKHLVAVAYAWLVNPELFTDLRHDLIKMVESPDLPDYFTKLVAKNPINFLELVRVDSVQSPEQIQHSKRDVINLIRTIFREQQFKPDEIEANWAKINQINEILKPKLKTGDPEALIALQELIRSLFLTYHDLPNQLLTEIIVSNLNLIKEVIANYSVAELNDFIAELFTLYLNPTFWYFSEVIREHLVSYFNKYPHQLSLMLQDAQSNAPDLMVQIALFELLALLQGQPDLDEALEWLQKEIIKEEAGQLWLIDRLIGIHDYDQAFQLARTGLKQQRGQAKRGFRERLIELHRVRGEFKQAAALSFRHFEEQPGFEEYLRLKELIGRYPDEYRYYCRKVDAVLLRQNNQQLRLRIKLDQSDYQWVQNNLEVIREDQALILELAKYLLTNLNSDVIPLYTLLIEILLADGQTTGKQVVIDLLIRLKRYFLQYVDPESWKSFSEHLIARYDVQRQLSRKYRSIFEIN